MKMLFCFLLLFPVESRGIIGLQKGLRLSKWSWSNAIKIFFSLTNGLGVPFKTLMAAAIQRLHWTSSLGQYNLSSHCLSNLKFPGIHTRKTLFLATNSFKISKQFHISYEWSLQDLKLAYKAAWMSEKKKSLSKDTELSSSA